jgi:SAM-dependent methyltransferase
MVDRSIWSFASGRQPEECVQQHVGPDKLGDIIRLDMNPAFPVDVAASVTALPFRDNSIDSISSNSLFEHVPYPHDILREAFRVLRAGGALRSCAQQCPFTSSSTVVRRIIFRYPMPTPQQTRCGISRTAFGCATAPELDAWVQQMPVSGPSRRQHERDGRPCVWRMPAPPSLLGLFAMRYPNYFEQIIRPDHLPTDPKPLQGTRPYFIATRGDLTLFTCHGATGNHGVRCYHQWFLRLPLNPLECG